MGDYFRNIINEDESTNDPDQRSFIEHLRETLRKGQFVDDETAIEVIR